jgi:5-methylthioadenosine/S-adenosylhomocysteine deaminase
MDAYCDLLITDAHIVTMDDYGRQIEGGAVAVTGPQILAVGPGEELRRGYSAQRVLDAGGKMLLPGFINTHTHLFQGLLKGLGDGLDLLTWINRITGPAAIHMSHEDAYIGALMACMENLFSGCTTVVEFMYGHPDHSIYDPIAQGMLDSGVRAVFGRGLAETGTDLGILQELVEPAERGLANLEQLYDRFHGRDGRMIVSVAVGVVWGMTREGLSLAGEFARQHNLPLQIHLNEYPVDDQNCLERFGKRTFPFLEELGFLGPDVLAAHCVHVSEDDISIIARTGTKVSHNPVSNMYLGAGVMPLTEMIEAGVEISLGTDGAASNNSQNMLEAMKMAVLLQRVRHRDPAVMNAWRALWMATRGGARALGLDSSLGSIEPGKLADMVLVDLHRPSTVTYHDAVASLVYSANPCNVTTVIVNGKVVVEDGEFVGHDRDELLRRAQAAGRRLREKIIR